MANQIKPQSKSLPAAKDTPILQPKESPSYAPGMPNYQSAFSSAAFSPNSMAELGNKMSLSASVALAQKAGTYYGKNPKGELIPAITQTDKAFSDAYSAQAESTLGLQVQSMMLKGREEMEKQYQLTPQMIQQYTSNMAQGINDALKLAPSTIRPNLENQFASQLMKSSHNFTMSMIDKNKQIAQQTSAVWQATQLQSMHDTILDGDMQGGADIYNSIQQRIKSELSGGMISPTQAYKLEQESKLNLYSSSMIQQAIEARNGNKVEQFLSDMPKSKPESLTWGEWEHVYNQTVAYVGALENLSNRNDSLVIAQARARASTAPLTPDYIEEIREQLPATKFLNFMTSYRATQIKQSKTKLATDDLAAHWTDTLSWSNRTKDQINGAYDLVVQDNLNKAEKNKKPLTQVQAETLAAETAQGAVPKFLDTITKAITSGNPQLVMDYSGALDRIQNRGGQKTRGLDKSVFATHEAFKHFLSQGYTTGEAAAFSKTMLDRTPEDRERIEETVSAWEKKTAKNDKKTLSWARDIAGISEETQVLNQAGFANYLKDIFKDNLRYSNGNEQIATNMLQSALKRNWGTTEVNGQQQFTIYPIEKVLDLEAGALPLIQDDIHEQLKTQFDATQEGYNKGLFNYYYRLKERVTFYDFEQAQKTVDSFYDSKNSSFFDFLGKFGESATNEEEKINQFNKARETIKEYKKGNANVVEMVYSDGTVQEYPIEVRPGSFMTASGSENPTIGDYDIVAMNPSKLPIVLYGSYIGQQHHPIYRPNINKIKSRYFDINGIVGDDPQGQFEADKVLSQLKTDTPAGLPGSVPVNLNFIDALLGNKK
jgi:hypothetical protein